MRQRECANRLDLLHRSAGIQSSGSMRRGAAAIRELPQIALNPHQRPADTAAVTLRNAVFALVGLALTGAASLWLLTLNAAEQATLENASAGHLTAWLGYAGAGGAIVAGLSALAISLSARERGPVRAFARAVVFAAALLFAYASRGGLG